jgi:hypothetical protein
MGILSKTNLKTTLADVSTDALLTPTTPTFSANFDESNASKALQLNNILKAIPEKAFEKSLLKSLFYMFFDYAMIGGAFLAMFSLVNSPVWGQLAFWQQALASVTYWNVAGKKQTPNITKKSKISNISNCF